MPPEVGPEVRCLLVDLAAVGVVTQVHGRLPGGAGGVHTQRTPALLTLPPIRSLNRNKFRIILTLDLRLRFLGSRSDKYKNC